MGTDDLFKKARVKRETRKSLNKKILDNILILCEGEKTDSVYPWYQRIRWRMYAPPGFSD